MEILKRLLGSERLKKQWSFRDADATILFTPGLSKGNKACALCAIQPSDPRHITKITAL